mgnify:CR=1 FL=1
MGDVVQALPVLRHLKRHFPQSEIYWWIETGLAPLLEDDTDLAGIIRFDRRRWAEPRNWARLWRDLRWMRQQAFDWVIDLQCLARSGAFAWLANGQLLIGLDEPREGARGYYDLVARRPSYHTHAVDWYLSVLPLLGVPTAAPFAWLPERPAVAAAIRSKWPVEGARWILLQPGARWVNKRWPVEYFAALVRAGRGFDSTFRFAILGGNEDREFGAIISRADPTRCLDLTGRLSLPEMVEWIRAGELLVTNDTGPMHVAAALGRPVVALFGPTEPRRTGPYGQIERVLRADLPCAPCMSSRCRHLKPLECLTLIPPERVWQEVQRRLAEPSLPVRSAST